MIYYLVICLWPSQNIWSLLTKQKYALICMTKDFVEHRATENWMARKIKSSLILSIRFSKAWKVQIQKGLHEFAMRSSHSRRFHEVFNLSRNLSSRIIPIKKTKPQIQQFTNLKWPEREREPFKTSFLMVFYSFFITLKNILCLAFSFYRL